MKGPNPGPHHRSSRSRSPPDRSIALTRIVGGLLAGLIFKRVWKLIGRGDAPKPTDERRGWGEILLAAVLQGAIFALVKAAADRGAAEGTRRLTGIWPGDEGQQPDEPA